MFDPTAFENMKVVLEGNLYDKDLSGEIKIIDRNDIINTAKLSRHYDLTFKLCSNNVAKCSCKLTLSANIENLTAELLRSSLSDADRLAGCTVTIELLFDHEYDESLNLKVEQILKEIWGVRKIDLIVLMEPLTQWKKVKHKAMVTFDRLIYEDQIDDLIEMIQYIVRSLAKMDSIL